jgi:hypothetical protein
MTTIVPGGSGSEEAVASGHRGGGRELPSCLREGEEARHC